MGKSVMSSRFLRRFVLFKTSSFKRCISGKVLSSNVRLGCGESSFEIESGRLAKFADGSAVIKEGETSVLVTAVSKKLPTTPSFLPLTVDYRLKAAAAGRIPTNYFRRERGPSDEEVLAGRAIDRSIRPLIPLNCQSEIQVMCNVLAVDGEVDPTVLSINAASAAISLSSVPWDGPVGAVRVGVIDGKIVINPRRGDMDKSQLNLIIAGSSKGIVMLEGGANILDKGLFKLAISKGFNEINKIINAIQDLVEMKMKSEKTWKRQLADEYDPFAELIQNLLDIRMTKKLRKTLINHKLEKFERDSELKQTRTEALDSLKGTIKNKTEEELNVYIDRFIKEKFRDFILDKKTRCDGRSMIALRNISCEVDVYRPLHGSALFQRGQTQVLCTLAYDSLDMSLKGDSVTDIRGGLKEKNFMLHYEFPPYATNEIGRPGMAGRREIGHGALAERGLYPVIPDNLPFTLRLTSEVLESNGSSSMASVCGGSLALMDAGVKIKEPAAGVAIGLFTKTTPDGTIQKQQIVTDLLGIEDYMGDMDFKIAGTKSGITALQADIKLKGIPVDLVHEAIDAGADGINRIIDIMNKVISEPRSQKENAPVTEEYTVNPQKRKRIIGIGGSNLKKIQAKTGIQLSYVDESTFQIFAPNKQALAEGKEMMETFLEEKPVQTLEYGAICTVKIVEISQAGVTVQVPGEMEPAFIHRNQLDARKVDHTDALGLTVGREIQVQYLGTDPHTGSLRLSRRPLIPTPKVTLFRT